MTANDRPESSDDWPLGPPPALDRPSSTAAVLHWGLRTALALDARRIDAVDLAWQGWPWDDEALQRELAAWLRRPGRELHLYSHGFETCLRRYPRFDRWRAPWSHALHGSVVDAQALPQLPTLLVCDRGFGLQLLDASQGRGVVSRQPTDVQAWRQQVAECASHREAGLAVKKLGL